MGHEYGSTFNTQKATLLPTHPLFEELQQFLVVPNVLAKSRQVTQIFETLVDAPFSCLSRLGWAGTREEMVPEAKVRLKIYVKKTKYPQTSESRGVGGLRFISSCKTCESFFEVLPFASGLWSASEVVVFFPSNFCWHANVLSVRRPVLVTETLFRGFKPHSVTLNCTHTHMYIYMILYTYTYTHTYTYQYTHTHIYIYIHIYIQYIYLYTVCIIIYIYIYILYTYAHVHSIANCIALHCVAFHLLSGSRWHTVLCYIMLSYIYICIIYIYVYY